MHAWLTLYPVLPCIQEFGIPFFSVLGDSDVKIGVSCDLGILVVLLDCAALLCDLLLVYITSSLGSPVQDLAYHWTDNERCTLVFPFFCFPAVLQKLLCRSKHNEGYCVPHSLQQNAGSCSAGGLWNQCGGNDLCFVRGPEEESLEKWYVHCPHLHQLACC